MADAPAGSTASQATGSGSGTAAGSSSQQSESSKDDTKKKSNAYKRTKTGCLTCRKRRIKCDEGRPICLNCYRSKRYCEGYVQRVVFKNPYNLKTEHFTQSVYNQGAGPSSAQYGMQQPGPTAQGPLQAIAPKPPAFPPPPPSAGPAYGTSPYGFAADPLDPFSSLNQPVPNLPPGSSSQNPFQQPPGDPTAAWLRRQLQLASAQDAGTGGSIDFSKVTGDTFQSPELQRHLQQFHQYQQLQQQQHEQQLQQQQEPQFLLPIVQPHEPHGSADEDDISLGDSEDERMTNYDSQQPHGSYQSSAPPFTSNAVAEYMPSLHTEGLLDPEAQLIFGHFINVTGPTMSLYERHSFDQPSRKADPLRVLFENKDKSNFWSYTWPVLAFHHPGLLHAILALASLQVSTMQEMPPTAALKHYHIAIRRVAKNVNTPSRRTKPATLAASLLLAYFEVWSSDHAKWCNHLFGGRMLLREIPLRAMSKVFIPAKRMRLMEKLAKDNERQRKHAKQPETTDARHREDQRRRLESELRPIDFVALSEMYGQPIIAQDYGLSDAQVLNQEVLAATEKDVEQYEIFRDLFWWYCKMDAYQGILGGSKLFMEYKHWTQCLPRAAMNQVDATYGTYDHLMLLLGRAVDFSSRDLRRKRKAHRASGMSAQGTGSPPDFMGMLPIHGKIDLPRGFSPLREVSPQVDDFEDADPEASLAAAAKEWHEIREAFKVFERNLSGDFLPLKNEESELGRTPFGRILQYRTYAVAGIWMNYNMGLIHLYRSHPHMHPAAMVAASQAGYMTATFANDLGRIAYGLMKDSSKTVGVGTVLAGAMIESGLCLFVAAIQYQSDRQRQWVVQWMLDITRLTGWQTAVQIADGCESCWIKSHQLGRGPMYVSPVRRTSIPRPVWDSARRIDRKLEEEEQDVGSEDKQLVLSKPERAHYALGLLGIETDLERFHLKDLG